MVTLVHWWIPRRKSSLDWDLEIGVPSSMNNSDHFVQLLKAVNIQTLDILINFSVVSLFTNVPVDEVLCVISNKLHNNGTLA
jgi:hypothetical protein